jgi:hypothetical protein
MQGWIWDFFLLFDLLLLENKNANLDEHTYQIFYTMGTRHNYHQIVYWCIEEIESMQLPMVMLHIPRLLRKAGCEPLYFP